MTIVLDDDGYPLISVGDDETLYCRCGIPVRIVRLGRSLLTLCHLRNPGHNHPAHLAPSSAVGRADSRIEDIRRQSGAPDDRRGDQGSSVPRKHLGADRTVPPRQPQTARRAQDMSLPLGSRARPTPRRADPAPGRPPESGRR